MAQPYLQTVSDGARFEAGSETVDIRTASQSSSTRPPEGGDSSGRTRRAGKSRAGEAIPTDRLKFENQLRVLLAVAATSGNARRGSTAEAMSAAIDLGGTTGGLNSRFFRAAGWFESVGRGEYTASAGLLAYNQHITIDPDAQFDATAGMREEVQASWFWKALDPILANGSAISQKLATLELAKAAGATNHTAQLHTVLDWLNWVGLIVREGDQIRLVRTDVGQGRVPLMEQTAPAETTSGKAAADDEAATQDSGFEGEGAPAGSSAAPAPSSAAVPDVGAIVSFNMSVRLTAADMQSMDQDQRDFVLSLAERLRG